MTTTTKASLTVTAGHLRPALTALAKVVKKNAALPVLQCVKVETVNRKTFRLTGTDLDSFFSIDVPAEISAKTEPFLVPLTRLQEQIRGAKAADPVRIPPGKAPPLSEFPVTPKFRASPIELEPQAVESLLKAFACASTDESRYVLQGACLDVSGKNGHHIIATDGRHLFVGNSVKFPRLKDPVILPALKVFDSNIVRLDSDPWTLRIASGNGKAGSQTFRVDGSNWNVTGRLIDGNFPNYRQVIPPDRNFKTRVTLPETALEPLVKAIRQMPGRKAANRPVGLRIDADSIGIVAREEDALTYEEIRVPLAGMKGEKTTVFLNRDYLVKALSFGLNRIEIIDEKSPVRCAGETEFMIIMPVRQPGEIRVEHSSDLSVAPAKAGRSSPPRKKPTPKPSRNPAPSAARKRQPPQDKPSNKKGVHPMKNVTIQD